MVTDYTITSGKARTRFVLCPIKPDWILEGEPVARVALLSRSADGKATTCYWDCTAGRFNWYYGLDETVHVLEGAVTLKSPRGHTQRVLAGDTVFFPAGSHAEWTVDTYVRKLAFLRAGESSMVGAGLG